MIIENVIFLCLVHHKNSWVNFFRFLNILYSYIWFTIYIPRNVENFPQILLLQFAQACGHEIPHYKCRRSKNAVEDAET